MLLERGYLLYRLRLKEEQEITVQDQEFQYIKRICLDKISTHNDKGDMCKHTRLKKIF